MHSLEAFSQCHKIQTDETDTREYEKQLTHVSFVQKHTHSCSHTGLLNFLTLVHSDPYPNTNTEANLRPDIRKHAGTQREVARTQKIYA